MHLWLKDTDRIRLCVDLSRLNRYVKRERYQSSAPAQAVADIAAEEPKVFTKLYSLKGYYQLRPAKVQFGRFQFLRALFGIFSITEHYNRRMDEAFEGYRRIVDDTVRIRSSMNPMSDNSCSVA